MVGTNCQLMKELKAGGSWDVGSRLGVGVGNLGRSWAARFRPPNLDKRRPYGDSIVSSEVTICTERAYKIH